MQRPLTGAALKLGAQSKIYVTGVSPASLKGEVPSYEELGETYKAVRAALRLKEGASAAGLFNAAGKGLGWEKFCAALFTFVDLGIIIYKDGGFSLPEKVEKRELSSSGLYRRLQEEYDG